MMESSNGGNGDPTGKGSQEVAKPPLDSLSSFKTQPISKHYAFNNQLLAAFDLLYQQELYKGAYAFGIQFLEVALLEIPKHGYFYAKRHRAERLENTQNALRVTKQLQHILERQPQDASQEDRDRVKLLQKLAEEQESHELQLAELYEKDRREAEWQLANFGESFCGDILDYAQLICPIAEEEEVLPSTRRTQDLIALQEFPSDQALLGGSGSVQGSGTSATTAGSHRRSSLSAGSMTGDELQRALFASGIAEQPGEDELKHRRVKTSSSIDIRSLQLCYHEDFDALRNRGRVRISQAETYQGRLPGSINGCTVIAPLLCLHHFHNADTGKLPDHGLPDGAIVEVIDVEAPAILPQVREQLELTKDALIIPSDVHDFLIERQLLSSEQFVSVLGGNILDDQHLSKFVSALQNSKPDSPKDQKTTDHKLAATFFFHEHVIAILKLQRSETESWYDLIDSLPNQETLLRVFGDLKDEWVPKTSRIRCVDEEALKASLRWYACSRFTDENKQYIDMYDFDEACSDFDPRVFQAFVWAELM